MPHTDRWTKRVQNAKRRRKVTIRVDRFTKLITFMAVIHGMVLVTLSYILAWIDKEPVADVSVALIGEIIAPIVVYLATNMIANIFEKNKLSFSEPIKPDDDDL